MRAFVGSLYSLILAAPLLAGEAIAPFVDEQTIVVARVDITKVKVEALVETLARWTPANEVRTPLQLWLDAFVKAEIKEAFAGMSLSDPLGQPYAIVPLTSAKQLQALQPVLATLPKDIKFEAHKGFLLIGTAAVLQRLRGPEAGANAELTAAFTATTGSSLQIAFLLPPLVRKSLREVMPRLPKELGGGSIDVLDPGFRWGALGIDFPPNGAVRATIQAQNAESAQALAELSRHALVALTKVEEFQSILGKTDLLPLLTPKVNGDRLVVQLKEEAVTRLLAPAVGNARIAAQRAQSMNSLKQLALAMHLYLDMHNTFPPAASHDANGNAMLSWRVHLLPMLDQTSLYKEFRLNEAWDSPHNKKLIPRMPAMLRSPLLKDAKPGMTTYLVPVGKDTIFAGPKGAKINDITDGTSATILIVEVNDANAVIWTKPDDLDIAAPNLLQRLVRPEFSGFLAAYADGSVRVLRDSLDRDDLSALFTRGDGRVVNP